MQQADLGYQGRFSRPVGVLRPLPGHGDEGAGGNRDGVRGQPGDPHALQADQNTVTDDVLLFRRAAAHEPLLGEIASLLGRPRLRRTVIAVASAVSGPTARIRFSCRRWRAAGVSRRSAGPGT